MKEIVQTEKAPKAVGPYSQAVKSGNFLFVSGQIPLDPDSNEVVGAAIEEQAEQVLKNLSGIIQAAGLNMENVVKCSCFISDMDNFQKFNAVYGKYFNENPPSRECVEVSKLPKNVLIEVSAICEF